MNKFVIFIISISLVVSGCASTQYGFMTNTSNLDDLDVCQNYVKDFEKIQQRHENDDESERIYLNTLLLEVNKRGLSPSYCANIVSERDSEVVDGVVAVGALLVFIALAVAAGGGGSSQGYAWDQFYDEHYNLIWRCRDKSNGEFAYDSHCSGLTKSDSTWPKK